MKILIAIFCLWSQAFALTVDDVNVPPTYKVDGQELILNGAGLRAKRIIFNIHVYVGALYVKAKSSDADALINSTDPQAITMVFKRGLSKSTLKDAWSESIKKNCRAECDHLPEWFAALDDVMTDVKENDGARILFNGDTVVFEIDGKKHTSGKITSAAFRKSLMAAFIGKYPPTEDFKKALLGI